MFLYELLESVRGYLLAQGLARELGARGMMVNVSSRGADRYRSEPRLSEWAVSEKEYHEDKDESLVAVTPRCDLL